MRSREMVQGRLMVTAAQIHNRLCRLFMVVALTLASCCPGMAGCYDRDATGRQQRFELAGGKARDRVSGLIWQRCSLGTTWDGKNRCVGQTAYLGLNEATAAATDGWRVPSGAELQGIVDVGCGSPVVDPTVFPDIRPDDEGHAKYWTTSAFGTLDLYRNFDFVDGLADSNSRGIRLAVRLVRTKQ
jgi:hypothetical protein